MSTHLDGNVLAGALADFFAPDVTALQGRCGGCGNVAGLAEAMVYTDAPGLVVRCKGCDHVLATLVDAGERLFLSLSGFSAVVLSR